jgi:hypothetical protein
VKITGPKFVTNAGVLEIINNPDLDACEVEDPNECEETDQEITLPEEADYSSVEQEIILEPLLQRGQKRKHQAHTDRDLGWKQNIYPIKKRTFSGQPGLNPNLTIMKENSPDDFFNLFFDNEMFGDIQSETNRYAEQQINVRKHQDPLKPKSVYAQWTEISIYEIKIFFAVVIHMCLVKKLLLRDYWTAGLVLHTDYATRVWMSQDQFLAILTYV